ncbi:MAG: hypothetical protein HZA92_01145 [Verrucomicrobia bacterium]|nr:hypothetical protein [Verrucomicrobiota bacterium]
MLGIKMKTFPFVTAAILVSGGCLSLLFHHPELTGFALFPVVLSGVSQYLRPPRVILILWVFFVGLTLALLACGWLLPSSTFATVQDVVCHPAFVLPLWMFTLLRLFRWRKELQS